MINQMVVWFREMLRGARASEEKGQTLIEYALLVALIAIIVIVALLALGPQIAAIFDAITGELGDV